MSNARLVARDATGSNPVVLIAFPSNVVNSAAGDRVLAATSAFMNATTPALTPDFICTNPIPASYVAAGSLTFEDDYALKAGAATFTNNARSSGMVLSTAAVEGGIAAGQLLLGPPSPNPARNSMAFRVVLPRASRVQVRILDLGGRVVSALVDESLPAGQHAFAWDRGHAPLSSGVYFLDLNAGGVRKTQRFVVIE